ncbi:hypothetical protein GQR58_006810 [Nymphon striatum]|nr:hypothetical protein GQR58_006810 [Nymphon striatum]
MGQRKTVSDQLRVYTEHQFTHETKQSGVGHTFGLDYQVSKELVANLSVQSARLDKEDSGLTDRDAFSVGLSYKQDATDASTRLEYRRDKGSEEDTEQWVTTNKVNYRLSPSLRLQGKFNYSETKDQRGNTRDASFTEAALGFALRPINHDRLNILGRLRSDRDSGAWSRNDATLAAARVRYHMTKNWDAMAEYHWLNSDESKDTQHGAMISIDRHLGKNMKIGVGYNFT